MNNSYDYADIIKEITEEINAGMLTTNEFIFILRADEPINDNYYPIIEWNYGADLDDEDMAEYIEDENNQVDVAKITVKDVLSELNGRHSKK